MKQTIITLIAALLLGISPTVAQNADADADSIRLAIERWVRQYPETQYADIYKNFFQDSFGPGHILTNQDAARKYLERELAEADKMDGPMLEPTGDKGRFIRVNLSVIKDRLIPIDTYFDAFVKSMDALEVPTGDEWRQRWEVIDGVITDMGLHFPNEPEDRAIVKEALDSGDFAVHHSQRYNAAYSRHYRIIRSDIVHKELMPLLQNTPTSPHADLP